jgi:4-amino-4-deoxychorismate lyase
VLALRNGRPVAGVPVIERGLAYGDGLFETLKVVAGRPQFLALHLDRVARDCSRLDIRLDLPLLRREIASALQSGHSGILKLIVTRAAALRGYQAPRNSPTERLLLFYPQTFPTVPVLSAGVSVRTCRQRLAEQPTLAGMKHLNRLERALSGTILRSRRA